ncbi:hypothetical protein M9Y10_027497 [Tritrichomonas musculus]|uniref:Serine/threonine-protein kinase TOR n=1 Tax=Tritrichomonas musculus TaxID=1915356 RepID=A0ABR2H506_9EUKA
MNLRNFMIPSKFADMIKAYEKYYHGFYLEMVRMSNTKFSSYVQKYLDLLLDLSRRPLTEDSIRAAIGVVSLHQLGYQNFNHLSSIFDRLIPQMDEEYIKFTSWCVENLTEHPNIDETQYAQSLFLRALSWTRSKGRRARPLAAAHMLHSLSLSCGSIIVSFFPQLQTALWSLVSSRSLRILKSTADAISAYTRSISKYGRNYLNEYMDFFSKVCIKLLSSEDPISQYGSLCLFEELINEYPDYFVPNFINLLKYIAESTEEKPVIVKGQAFIVIASLSAVNPVGFVESIAEEFFQNVEEMLLEFPVEVTRSLCRLCKNIPDFISGHDDGISKIEQLKDYAYKLVDQEPDSAFRLLTTIFDCFQLKSLPIKKELMAKLIDLPLSEDYKNFLISLSRCQKSSNIIEKFNKELPSQLCAKLVKELRGKQNSIALNIISELHSNFIYDHELLLKAIWPLIEESSEEDTRVTVPRALFNITKSTDVISTEIVTKRLLQFSIYEPSINVRCSILQVMIDNTEESFAQDTFLKYYEMFMNDDSSTVRELFYKLLINLAPLNPMTITSLTRSALLNAFFIIRKVPSIRKKAKTIRGLPYLIQASKMTIKAYSGGLMEIIMNTFDNYNPRMKFENFLEEDAQTSILIGITHSLINLAPLDPEQVAKHAPKLIPILCDIVLSTEHRLLTIYILELFYELLSGTASTIDYRIQIPIILSTCSTFLANTHSRKGRIVTLKVLGAIGCAEVHQRPPPKGTQAPKNMDEDLARMFFHPTKDTEGVLDDALLLLNRQLNEQYFLAFVAKSLLEVFNNDDLHDFYEDTVRALVEVLHHPKMPALAYFDAFVARLLTVLENASEEEIESLLPLFSLLIMNSTHNTSPFLKRSLEFISKRFNIKQASLFIDLVIALVTAVRDGFASYSSDTISLLVVLLDDNKTIDINLCKKVLTAYGLIGVYSADLLYLMIPQICDAIVTGQTLTKVRIYALETLTSLARKVSFLPFLGPIARSLRYCFMMGNDPDSVKTINSAFELLYTLLTSLGISFLVESQPILDFLKREKKETPELKIILNNVSQGKCGTAFHPLDIDKPPPPPPSSSLTLTSSQSPLNNNTFSTDAIIAKSDDSNHMGRHVEDWFNSFILCVISNSPSSAIRACTCLATSYVPLANKLFNVAFFSVWKVLNNDLKVQLSKFFKNLLTTIDSYESIARQIIDLIVFMDKVEQPLLIPTNELVDACTRYGSMALALQLQARLFYETKSDQDEIILTKNLIDIYVQLGQWQNAVGVWTQSNLKLKSTTLSSADVLAKLRMWDKSEPMYQNNYNNNHNFKDFSGMIESLSFLAKWPRLMEYIDDFNKLEIQNKRIVASFFAEAALNLGKWDQLSEILKYTPEDNWICSVLLALNTLHNKEFDKIDEIIKKAFSFMASKPATFNADNQQIHQQTMLACQELIEVCEIRDWLSTSNQKVRDCIEEVWHQRLKMETRDFNLWFSIFSNRVRVASIRDDSLIQFFLLRSVNLGQQIHLNAFNILFPDYDNETSSDAQKLCHAIALWNVELRTEAVEQVRFLTSVLTGDLLMRANFFYSSWLLEYEGESLNSLKDAYNHLKPTVDLIEDSKIRTNMNPFDKQYLSQSSMVLPSPIYNELTINTTQIDMIRKWSDVNALLINADQNNREKYVINAIFALSRCAKLAPSFPDVVQMLNIFFENADNAEIFKQTSQMVLNLPTKLLLQAAPQINIQLSHHDKIVRSFVHNLIFDLLEVHYHDLIFSLLVLKHSKNTARARAAGLIIERLHVKLPDVFNEAQLIRSSLLRAAVTWNEKINHRIQDASEHYQRKNYDQFVSILYSIVQMVSKPSCELHYQFKKQYLKSITHLEQILKLYTPKRVNRNCISQLVEWCVEMQESVSEELKRTKTIQLSAISSELASKDNFLIAVFGTYRPNKPVNRIRYFVGQLFVYMSKQQPKDVVIKGIDGNFYQYLLKGHEDLRLDERIMQLFRMINSLMMKESSFLNDESIETISVIPLSMSHGLVQWAVGTDTIRSVIEQYRKMHHKDPMEEYALADEFGDGANYNYLLPIQKTQILEKIFQIVPDSDLSNFMWLKAPNVDVWLKQVSTYSISTAISSIVGYIIGLGDRHPSNLLIDRNTGKIVHIDFGDCFERASLRKYLPETVPFRLTRMMVRALGPGGVEGIFKTAFINMSSLLRANKQVLLNVISIFVHEPLIDPDVEENNSIMSSSSNRTDESSEGENTKKQGPHSMLFNDLPEIENESRSDESSESSDLSVLKPNQNLSFREEKASKIFEDEHESKNIKQYISSSEKMKSRVKQKLTGTEFKCFSNSILSSSSHLLSDNDLLDPDNPDGTVAVMSVEEQATKLIDWATDIYNLSKMYSGWCPFW